MARFGKDRKSLHKSVLRRNYNSSKELRQWIEEEEEETVQSDKENSSTAGSTTTADGSTTTTTTTTTSTTTATTTTATVKPETSSFGGSCVVAETGEFIKRNSPTVTRIKSKLVLQVCTCGVVCFDLARGLHGSVLPLPLSLLSGSLRIVTRVLSLWHTHTDTHL